jgi:hypothetical protein
VRASEREREMDLGLAHTRFVPSLVYAGGRRRSFLASSPVAAEGGAEQSREEDGGGGRSGEWGNSSKRRTWPSPGARTPRGGPGGRSWPSPRTVSTARNQMVFTNRSTGAAAEGGWAAREEEAASARRRRGGGNVSQLAAGGEWGRWLVEWSKKGESF